MAVQALINGRAMSKRRKLGLTNQLALFKFK